MEAEIITIGDELLLGQTIDTNSAWIGMNLSREGLRIARKTCVPDRREDILAAVGQALQRSRLVLLTGGLGPTKDDITKSTLCAFYKCGLRWDEDVVEYLKKRYAARGRELLDINKLQAQLPDICETLPNLQGTAPGMWFDVEDRVLISMPGVPSEMKHIMMEQAIPRIRKRFYLPHISHRTMLLVNKPESQLSMELEDFEKELPAHMSLAYLPNYNSLRLRLNGTLNDAEKLESEMQKQWDLLKAHCGPFLMAERDCTPTEFMASLLIEKGLSLSLAESCTGGFLSSQLVLIPGISAVFKGSILSYANEVKAAELGVPESILKTKGSVSSECAKAMVEGVRARFDSDLAISTTGIAGPGGATDEKPVGLVYIGVASRTKTIVRKYHMPGPRESFIQWVNISAMDLLRQVI